MTRVAVQVGAAWLRVAAEGRLVAELPVAALPCATVPVAEPSCAELPAAGPSAGTSLPLVLAGLFDVPVDELIVVEVAGVPPPARRLPVPPGSAVRAVPAAVAALAQQAASAGAAPAHAVVVDVGHGGTEVARVCAGRVVAVRRVAVGGARLDAVTAAVLARAGASAEPGEARRAREALSLLPAVRAGTPPVVVSADDLRAALSEPLAAVVDAVTDVVTDALVDGPGTPGRAPPVLLVGGVARTPLLAELLDAARLDHVHVADRPDAAAVLGALRLPDGPAALPVPDQSAAPRLSDGSAALPVPDGSVALRPPDEPSGSGSAPAWRSGAVVRPVRREPASAARDGPSRRPGARPRGGLAAAPPSTWLPPVVPARHRGARAALATLGATAGVLGLVAAGAALPAATPAPASAVASTAVASTAVASTAVASAGDLAQYGYAVRLPAGWAHTGGLPERRRSLLTPVAAPEGSDLISVERTPLGYDVTAEPQRARAELRARFAAAVRAGAPLSAFDDGARFAGRPVVSYREAGGPTGGDVDWYVLLDGDAQLSVGCRHTPAGRAAVGAACAIVVGSLHRTA